MADLRGGTIIGGFLALHKGNPNDLLDTIKTVDGADSGLDADLLDNMQPTSSQVANSIVARDASGNFSAGIVTAQLSGNASSASKWLVARTLSFTGDASGSVSFDGSANMSVAMSVTGGNAGHAGSADKLSAARQIALIGDVTGTNYFDGSGNVDITTTVVNDSHTHTNATISSLDWSKITTGKPTTLAGYGILDAATSAHLHDSQYLKLSGGTLTGDLVFSVDDDGINFFGGAKIYKKTSAGLRLRPHTSNDATGIIFEDAAGTNVRFQVKTDGSADGLTYNGAKVWHENNDGAGSGLDADKLDGLQADTTNTINTIVARDASGNFSAGTITAALSGNATTSTSAGKWTTARTITLGTDLSGSVSIDGSANVTLNATIIDANIDHGSIGGLADDDHTQYLNTTRHDTITRHTLGTVVPHDSLATLTDVTIATLASNQILYYDTTTSKWKNGAQSIIDHGSVSGLTDDDHTQYLNTARHDTTTRHGSSVVDHGLIAGLTDDDHTQYLNTTRHDTTARHGSGVVDHGSIGGLGDDDHAQYLNITRHDTTARHGATVIDHGLIGGLGDDDHTIYIKANGTRAFTGVISGITPTAGTHLVTKDYVDSKLQGLDWQESVKSKGYATPPATPAVGDRYIVRATATDAWVGHENKIAEWTGSAWALIVVDEGSAVYVEDEDVQYTFNGTAWVTFGSTTNHNATSGLQGGTTGQYYHLNSTEYTDLHDGGDCTIHYHATDRNLANASGTLAITKGGTGLSAIATDQIIYGSAANVYSTATLTSFARTLLDDADAATMRTTLGLGNSATLNTGTASGTVATGNHTHSNYTPFATLAATTAATANWYRIATSAVNIGANSGLFKVEFSGTGVMGRCLFIASCHNGTVAGSAINQLGFTTTAATLGLTQVRVVYHTTYTANYAYVEVYNPTALAITYTVDLIDSTGWTLTTPSTVGSIPTGYTSESLILDTGLVSMEDVTATRQLVSKIATGTAPLVVSSTTKVANLNADLLDDMNSSTTHVASTPTIVSRDSSGNFSANLVTLGIGGTSAGLKFGSTLLGTSVTGNDYVVLGASQGLRISDGTAWDYNQWGGIKYNSTTKVLYIGGPAGGSTAGWGANATPPTIDVNFVGLNSGGLKVGGTSVSLVGHTHAGTDITSTVANATAAVTATKLATTRNIALTGSVTGNANFDGSGNISIATTTNHVHSVATQSADGFMSAVDKTKLDSIFMIRTGSGNYAGLSNYTSVPLTNATNYNVIIQSNGTSNGDLGEIWVIKQTDCFLVYNSGSATSIFDYTVVPLTMQGMLTGSGVMAGLSNYTQINFTDLGKVTYTVDIIPTALTDGKVGEFWVIKSTNNFKLYNTGSYIGAFDYTIFY